MTQHLDKAIADVTRMVPSISSGPWHVGVGGNAHANRVWTENMQPIVALCSRSPQPPDLCWEAQANGRLIASAPDMLKALQLLEREWNDSRLSSNGFILHLRDTIMPEVRAALAKAVRS